MSHKHILYTALMAIFAFALVSSSVADAEAPLLTRTLDVGSRGTDVETLQTFLKQYPDIYPEGLVTGYFGVLTQRAAMRFQKEHGIEQVGTVGPKTRAKINEVASTQSASALATDKEIPEEFIAPALDEPEVLIEEGTSTPQSEAGTETLSASLFSALSAQAQTVSNNSKFFLQAVQTRMTAGERYRVHVTFQNPTTVRWTEADKFRLGSQAPQDNTTWGVSRAILEPAFEASNGSLASFTFFVTAPKTPGNYIFQWRMLKEGVEWFGEYSPRTIITVTTDSIPDINAEAKFISQKVPTTMIAGQGYVAEITMKNRGTEPWEQKKGYRLGSQSPRDNTTWGTNRHDMGGLGADITVLPGQEYTFLMGVVAPRTPGQYKFRWGMLQERVRWFGELTPEVEVNVVAAAPPSQPAPIFGFTTVSGVPAGYQTFCANENEKCNFSGTSKVYYGTEGSFSVTAGEITGPVDCNNATFGDPKPGVKKMCYVKDGSVPLKKSNSAAFADQGVPTTMKAGQKYNVWIQMRNDGSTTWEKNLRYELGYAVPPEGNALWGMSSVELPGNIAPGQKALIVFPVTAPSTPGTYPFRWRMLRQNVGWFGEYTPEVTVNVISAVAASPPAATVRGNSAQVVGQMVDSHMTTGEKVNVTVTMRNIGTTTWRASEEYRLGSQSPQDNAKWGMGRVELPKDVAPGEEVQFSWQVTAPTNPGIHTFRWRMLREQVEWFGEYTPEVKVTVALDADTASWSKQPNPGKNAATFAGHDVPQTMVTGQKYDVSVTMRNTGTSVWKRMIKYHLGSQSPRDNTKWGISRVVLPNDVAPGETVALRFTVTAPVNPGLYPFRWRMLREQVEWFGEYSPELRIRVGLPGKEPPAETEKNDAQFVKQSVPAEMRANNRYAVSVTMKNTGTKAWTLGELYRLGSQSPQDNTKWQVSRVSLGRTVPPGETVTFTFPVIAPREPGTYPFRWRMLREHIEWFGEYTPEVTVNVVSATTSQTLLKSIPSVQKVSIPNTQLSPGDTILYRFSVRAGSTGPIGLRDVAFYVSSSSVAATTSNFRLYGYADSAFSQRAFDVNPITPAKTQGTKVRFPFVTPVAIGASATVYFELRGDVTNPNSSVGNVINIQLLGDSVATKLANYIPDRFHFVWSPMSTTSLLSDLKDTPDWTNGYNVLGLPSPVQTLSN